MYLRICICLILFQSLALANPSICLSMIVKNESHVIRRALDSVKDKIDYWVIIDTGSTDGTQKIIKEHMTDIPGQLEERPWVNFAHNRNESLVIAQEHGDYILFLDADDWLQFEQGFIFPNLTEDAYTVTWYYGTDFSYSKLQLIKATTPWRWEGILHEYLTCDRAYSQTHLPQIKYLCGGDGARSQDPEKFLKAANVLKEALKTEPNNTRYVFYLAESLRDAGKQEEAISYYLKRVEMGGWEEEVFWSLFQVAQLKNMLNKPQDEIIQSYYRAHYYRPHRIEPVYYLANIFNRTGNYALAYASIKGYRCIAQPHQPDVLFHLNWIQDYGLDFELSLSAYYLGHQEEFSLLCQQLNDVKTLPPLFKKSLEHNIALIHNTMP